MQKGSSANFLLVAALEKAGLSFRTSSRCICRPRCPRRLRQWVGDAWVVWDPYLAAIQQSQPVRVLADYKGLLQRQQLL